MNKFSSTRFRDIQAEDMSDAAKLFAERQARKEFGKSGYVRLCRADSWAQDGSFTEYEAFIGYTPKGEHNRNSTVGRNFRFTVHRA